MDRFTKIKWILGTRIAAGSVQTVIICSLRVSICSLKVIICHPKVII